MEYPPRHPSEVSTGTGDNCQAVADEVVPLYSEVQRYANVALEFVQKWGVRNELRLASHKTSVMLVAKKLKHDTPLRSIA